MYNLLKIVYWLIGALPTKVLYGLSSLFYYFIYYIVRYRRGTVKENLNKVFIEYSDQKKTTLEKKFYRHLCDVFFESAKYSATNKKSLSNVISFSNLELLDSDKSFILTTAHIGNWELNTGISDVITPALYAVYKPARNIKANTFIQEARKRETFHTITNKEINQFLRSKKKTPTGLYLIADQAPNDIKTPYQEDFLGQKDTLFLPGPEKLAKKYNLNLYYLFVTKPKRGKYSVNLELLYDSTQEVSDGELTRLYAEALERNILAQPEIWLWSYHRWKEK